MDFVTRAMPIDVIDGKSHKIELKSSAWFKNLMRDRSKGPLLRYQSFITMMPFRHHFENDSEVT